MDAADRGTIGRPDVVARLKVRDRVGPCHGDAGLAESREVIAIGDVVAEIVAHGEVPRWRSVSCYMGRRTLSLENGVPDEIYDLFEIMATTRSMWRLTLVCLLHPAATCRAGGSSWAEKG